MFKKDLGLFVLILVVAALTAWRQPLFLSPINIANTANLVGLFGIFAIGQGFVIMTGGIELSSGSMIAILGVIFIDLIANHEVLWPFAALIVLGIGVLMGLVHGLLITKLKLQPFVVTLCGLLIYRGIARFYTADATAGFPFGFAATLGWTAGLSCGLGRWLAGKKTGSTHTWLVPWLTYAYAGRSASRVSCPSRPPIPSRWVSPSSRSAANERSGCTLFTTLAISRSFAPSQSRSASPDAPGACTAEAPRCAETSQGSGPVRESNMLRASTRSATSRASGLGAYCSA